MWAYAIISTDWSVYKNITPENHLKLPVDETSHQLYRVNESVCACDDR